MARTSSIGVPPGKSKLNLVKGAGALGLDGKLTPGGLCALEIWNVV